MALPVTLPTKIGKRSKYRAIPTVVNNIRFASKLEAKRYTELRALEATGEITNLSLQPKYELHAMGGGKVGTYRGDFHYFTRATNAKRGESVLEDCKGAYRNDVYKWKKRHMAAEYPGVVIVEITR